MSFRLLLADDSITIQKVVSIIFSGEEYDLTIVNNGTDALEKAAEILPDVMLVDTLMPGASGYEVCERVRRDQGLRHIPILLLTGAFEPFDVDKARASGADDFISKPFESQVLIDKVKSLIALGSEREVAPPVFAPGPPPVSNQPEEDSVWSFDTPLVQEPEPSPLTVSAASSAPETDSVWEIDFQLEEAESPLQADEPSDQWQPAPEAGQEEVWQLEPSTEEDAAGVAPDQFFTDSPVSEHMIEVSPSDDLWGAFELEPVEEGAVDPVDILETYSVDTGVTVAEAEPFAFIDEPAAFAGEAAAPETVVKSAESAESFFFGTADAEQVTPVPDEEDVAASPFAPFEAAEPDTVFEGFAPPVAEVFPGEQPAAEEYFFSDTVAPQPEPAAVEMPQQAEPEVAAAGPAANRGGDCGALVMDEQQLAAVISRISHEVIEKVVWEVVPDLAEILIKEEIRKIKEGR